MTQLLWNLWFIATHPETISDFAKLCLLRLPSFHYHSPGRTSDALWIASNAGGLDILLLVLGNGHRLTKADQLYEVRKKIAKKFLPYFNNPNHSRESSGVFC